MSFLTDTTFQLQIEELVKEGYTYLEAIIQFCEENDLEFEDVKKLMTTNLKDKVKLDAMREGYMKQESMLPI
jgi:uncharacterized protein YdhG (YjbR/CyaY superfamily)